VSLSLLVPWISELFPASDPDLIDHQVCPSLGALRKLTSAQAFVRVLDALETLDEPRPRFLTVSAIDTRDLSKPAPKHYVSYWTCPDTRSRDCRPTKIWRTRRSPTMPLVGLPLASTARGLTALHRCLLWYGSQKP
jgi:hypothetical protein